MFDSHAHVLSPDTSKFPPAAPTSDQIALLRAHAFDAAQLCAAMDEAGVQQALVVQRSQFYGADNSYVCAAAQESAGRLRAVCGIDSLRDDCADAAAHWLTQGAAGLRIMGQPRGTNPDWLGGDRAHALWKLCADEGAVLCCHLFPAFRQAGLAIIEHMLARYPLKWLIVDHLANPAIASADKPGIDEALLKLDRPPLSGPLYLLV